MLQVVKKRFLLFIVAIILVAGALQGQTTIEGMVQDARTQKPAANVTVYFLLKEDLTDENGRFFFQTSILEQDVYLTFEKSGFESKTVHFQLSGQKAIDIGVIPLRPQEDIEQVNGEDFIPTITLETGQVVGSGGESISGLLTASRDLFVSTAAYNFGAARFRLRGYDGRNTTVYLNGVPVNDPESGYIYWSTWGGLNDVLRNRINEVGLGSAAFAFGGVGGATTIDTRASRQRRQIRASYAFSNRSYTNRAMLTMSTGSRPSGWAVTASGSRRWADEGFVSGTFYDGWSYFLSISKQLGQRHELNLTAFGAPISRGRTSAATQELYDLTGTNYYNPNWGFQAGEKRNARVFEAHQPMAILRHDWNLNDRTTLTTAASFQFGNSGTTALDWYDGRDPRPNYYRRLPSFIDNEQADRVAEKYRNDPAVSQIDWAYFYDVNRNNFATIEDVNGIPGNDVTGRRGQYIVEERRYDDRQLSFYTNLQSNPSRKVAFNGGVELQAYQGDNFKVVDDLLDADFYLDIDKFSERDYPGDPSIIQNDLSRPNRIVMKGDTFGYSYLTHLRRGAAWMQLDFSSRKVDFFLGGQASATQYWREGNWRNGRFPDYSLGESEKAEFLDYGGKAGITFIFNGRNFLQFMGAYLTRAPFLRDAFISPRTRNQLVANLESENIYGGEGGYIYQGPYLKARLTGYYTRFENQLFNRSFYLDNAIITEDGSSEGGFVNYIMQHINTQHFGLETAVEWTVLPGLRLNGVAALGQYTYINRPEVTVILDQEAETLREYTAYIKNFYVPNTPQTALSGGISYSSSGYWFASVNVNYFDDIWIDFNPDRRTTDAITYGPDPRSDDDVVKPDSPLWKDIIFQEKAPEAITVDFFGGKSWKIDNVFLYLNVGVNNLLDNRDFITGGYEQYRFDYETKDVDRFPNRYFYGLGRNYFVQLALRL
jgi:hypothetical protein